MKTIGERLEAFTVTAVKPGFNEAEENGESAFETLTEASFPGKWKIVYFYPKDFSRLCPTELAEFAALQPQFDERDAVLLGGSADNEYVKLAWRRDHPALDRLNHYAFGDVKGELIDQLGVRDRDSGAALRATFIVDPENVIQHVSVNPLRIGRNPGETLRILDGLLTGGLCPAGRVPGGPTLPDEGPAGMA